MNSREGMKRRQFLRGASGTIGLMALAQSIGPLAEAAENSAPAIGGDRAELQRLMAELEGKGRRMLSVPKEDGQFLNLLVKATRARNVLEVGTSQGYSAIWLSLGLEETDGKMVTVDIDPEKVRLAKANVAKANLAHRVTFHEGDAHQIITRLDGPFDFAFLDADKDGQEDYFRKLFPAKLAPGGIIAVHNAIHSRSSMRGYLEMVRQHPEFDTVVLSVTMDDGFALSYRRRR